MSTKMPTILTFMTSVDEQRFSCNIKSFSQNIVFIDIFNWPDPELRILQSIADRTGVAVALLNTDIITLREYQEKFVCFFEQNNYFIPRQVGKGLIQYLPSTPWTHNNIGLQNGRLSASYSAELDNETDAYVKAVYKIYRKESVKLHYLDPATMDIEEKPRANIFAHPDAVRVFDQVDGKYLISHAEAYFTSKTGNKE